MWETTLSAIIAAASLPPDTYVTAVRDADSTAWGYVIPAAVTVFLAVIGWVWLQMHGRVEKLEKAFAEKLEKDQQHHQELLVVIAEMRTEIRFGVGRLVSDAESEKDTRRRVNSDTLERITRLEEKVKVIESHQ